MEFQTNWYSLKITPTRGIVLTDMHLASSPKIIQITTEAFIKIRAITADITPTVAGRYLSDDTVIFLLFGDICRC